MEQQGEGRGKREENKQLQTQVPAAPQPQQHQKCPRCDSFNTKFCYYNNYSLSQPRYYCKSCKRYWTQGGTLRNIPVGGSRKGKRGNKTSSSSSGHKPYNRSSSQPLDQEMVQIQNQSNLAGPSPPTVVPSPIGGYLSSLSATVHSLNPPSQSQSQSQSLNFGFNDDVVSLIGSQQHSQILPPSRLYHMGKGGGAGEVGSSLFPAPAPAPQEGGFFIIPPSSMVNATIASSQNFMIMNDANSHRAPSFASSSLWSTISTTSISGNNNSQSNIIRGGSSSSSSSLIPNRHWPHLPGYDPPPE